MTHNSKKVLATLAAHGILNHNSARRIPDSFTPSQVCDFLGLDITGVEPALEWLEEQGYVRKRNTGYNGYGGQRVEGVDVWWVTAEGLVALWG